MIDDPSQRIGRPRQLYTGATERAYVPMEARSSTPPSRAKFALGPLMTQSGRSTRCNGERQRVPE